jgi:hypothetical protein
VNKKFIYLRFFKKENLMVKTYLNSSKILTMTKGHRPILYKPIYIDITGSKNAGILLYQVLLWCDWMNGEFYKSDKEFSQMIGLTFDEFRVAKKTLKDLGFIRAIKKGFPQKTYYSIGDEEFLKIRESIQKQNNVKYQSFIQSAEIPQTEGTMCGKSPPQSAEIPQTIHYIQRNNLSISIDYSIPAREIPKKERGMDGFNKNIQEEKYTAPIHPPSPITNAREEEELDRQTQQFINIWPHIPKKPGFKLVKNALRVALKKKSFAALCEHGEDFVKSQRRQRQDQFIPCAHTWLNQEKWPKFESKGIAAPLNPYAQAKHDLELKHQREKQMGIKLKEELIKNIGEESFTKYFHWKVCSISLRTNPISFFFDCESMREHVEKNYSRTIQEIISQIEELSNRAIEFKSTQYPPSKKLFDGFSSRKVLDDINNLKKERLAA